jgi:glutaredoxin-like protein NrdH
MAQITVHTTPDCRQCKMTKERLTAAGVDFDVIDLVENPAVLEELRPRLTKLVAPVVTFGDEIWNGFQPARIDAAVAQLVAA